MTKHQALVKNMQVSFLVFEAAKTVYSAQMWFTLIIRSYHSVLLR